VTYTPRKYPPRSKTVAHRKPRVAAIRPGADSRLKKVFATIGRPAMRPFQPDPFQLEAVAAVDDSDCLVSAPTGAGKTWIAVEAIRQRFDAGGRCWYASPLKALSNAKYAEFKEIFGREQVGILTGDRKENPDAAIIVGTTEILRNQLYDAMHRGEDLASDFVVLDEAHFLGDPDRGVVWEEVMIYLPLRIPLLLLSATIGNADQIAGWLTAMRARPCRVVVENRRPVPLYPLLLHPSGTLYPLLVPAGASKKMVLHKKVREFIGSQHPPRLAPPGRLPPFGDLLKVLRKFRLLPAIFFLKSRADCDNALDLCRQNQIRNPERQQRLSRRIAALVAQSPHVAGHRQMGALEHLAVAAHHSGQLPSWKILVETLMLEGLLDAVFATSTVAAGVNFPARTVAFLNSDRFNGTELLPLTATEFHQMTGRAGRRGMDQIGFALAVPTKFMDLRYIAKLIDAAPSPVLSQIKINFSMVLNLLLSHSPGQIEELLQKSFGAYQQAQARGRKGGGRQAPTGTAVLWQDFLRHLSFLKTHGYVDAADRLTADGLWASQLRVDQPLLIAEGFREALFPENDASILAGIIAAFVNEREVDDRVPKEAIPKGLLSAFLKVKRGLRPFAREMQDHGFVVNPLFFRPAVALSTWASGHSWEQVVSLAEIEEGNLAMLILRTADNLRHIRSLRGVFPTAADAAGRAIDLILRDPVVTFYDS
jgi:superfamily II RNA helicase